MGDRRRSICAESGGAAVTCLSELGLMVWGVVADGPDSSAAAEMAARANVILQVEVSCGYARFQ
jgi:hypothetical protein